MQFWIFHGTSEQAAYLVAVQIEGEFREGSGYAEFGQQVVDVLCQTLYQSLLVLQVGVQAP